MNLIDTEVVAIIRYDIKPYLSCRDQSDTMYCTRMVSLSMNTISGTRFTVDLSNSLISMSTVQSCGDCKN